MSTAISSPDNGRTLLVTVTVDMSKYGKNDAAANALQMAAAGGVAVVRSLYWRALSENLETLVRNDLQANLQNTIQALDAPVAAFDPATP